MMRIFFMGDIVGASGREAVARHLTPVFQTLKPDVVIANAENAAHGLGVLPRICDELFALGVDVITLGNHSFDKKEIIPYLAENPRVIRPANYPAGTAGRGHYVHTLEDGRKIGVVNLMGRLFMDPLDDPFATIDRLLEDMGTNIVFIDMHAEATSEKQAMAYWVDGRASAVVGTHTHVPTADARILPAGTAYLSDAGMCGDYNSVIGMKTEAPLENFTRRVRTLKLEPADGEGTLCGVVIDVDDATGHATAIQPVRLGGHLPQTGLAHVAAGMRG